MNDLLREQIRDVLSRRDVNTTTWRQGLAELEEQYEALWQDECRKLREPIPAHEAHSNPE